MLWTQIGAIWWAQFRTTRNHLPRRTLGSVLGGLVSFIWYGAAMLVGFGLAWKLPDLSYPEVVADLPMGLLGVFLFWQVGPLFTMSSGWSLQLNKLLMYPIPKNTLFGIEVFLRLTTAPEMLPVMAGLMIGLLRHQAVRGLWPITLIVFIPLNLFLSLAVRELVLHSFQRNRFRELFTILLISIGILPQVILRTGAGRQIHPYFVAVSGSRFTPWGEAARLALGKAALWEGLALLAWTGLFIFAADRFFNRALNYEDTLRAEILPERVSKGTTSGAGRGWAANLARLFPDPLSALIQKEFEGLVRMPRFRVTFGMACVFSVLIFLPLTRRMMTQGESSFVSNNFLVVVTLYGLLIMSDALMLNVFGMDRTAAQLYFVAPIGFRQVIYAKNLVAVFFMALQSLLVLMVVAALRMPLTATSLLNALAAAAVVGVFFLAAGNLSSVSVARPTDPTQTFRRHAGGKMQLWLLLCSVGMFALVGAAYLAQWGLGAAWAGFAVLGIEFAIGMVVYYVALDSAVARGTRECEKLLADLAKNASPIGLGS